MLRTPLLPRRTTTTTTPAVLSLVVVVLSALVSVSAFVVGGGFLFRDPLLSSFSTASRGIAMSSAENENDPTTIKKRKQQTVAAAAKASNFEEDLELTRTVIRRRFLDDDSSKDDDDDNKDTTILPNNNNDQQFDDDDVVNGSNDGTSSPPPPLLRQRTKPSYQELARMATERVQHDKKKEHAAWWCAVTGGPGAGKSTLARAVSEILANEHGIQSVVVQMDGYRYSRAELLSMATTDGEDADAVTPANNNPAFLELLRRRGAPHTIDAETLCNDLAAAAATTTTTTAEPRNNNNNNSSSFWFRSYDRNCPSDPRPNEIRFEKPLHAVVFVVGEYLLLGAGGMVPGYVTEDESRRWKPLVAEDLFDATWFVTCQQQHQPPEEEATVAGEPDATDFCFDEQRNRRIRYHLAANEDDPETIRKLFPYLVSSSPPATASDGSSSNEEPSAFALEVATKRTDSNDVLNMHVSETCKPHASLVVTNI